jgi:hypothetical protein
MIAIYALNIVLSDAVLLLTLEVAVVAGTCAYGGKADKPERT